MAETQIKPTAIDIPKLLGAVKPDVMGWINQAVANIALTGITITISDDYAKKNEIQTFSALQYFAASIVAAASGDSSVIIDSGLPSNSGVSSLILRSQGTDKANISVNTATTNQPLEINSAYSGDVSLVVGGGKVGIGDNAPDSALEIAAMSGAGYITLNEISAPSNPASDKIALYAKDDSGTTKLYSKNSAGQEVELGGSGVTLPSLSGVTAHYMAPWGYGHTDVTNPEAGVNQVRCCRFLIPIEITVASLHFEVTTGDSGKVANLGIYSSDGNTLLCNTGAVSITATGAKSVTLGSPVTLPAGMYWLAWTGNSSALRMRGVAADATAFTNAGTAQIGTAANSSSVGVFPSTLGAISAATHAPPKLKLQGA